MKPEALVTLPETHLYGVRLRTSRGAAMRDIPSFYEDTFAHDRLGLRTRPSLVYAVYTEYESDFRGAYTMFLATSHEGPSLSPVTVPAGTFARFAADGDGKIVVPAVWDFVNHAWSERSRRAYRTDFEVHGARGPNTADVYVALG